MSENSTQHESSTADIPAEKDPLASGPTAKKASSKHKRWITLGIAAVILVAAGGGFWVWHEQPSFCNAICHQPMDSYVEGYQSQDPALLASVHGGAQVSCLGCHVPTVSEQLAEGVSWVSGNYEMPLEQRTFDDAFCLNKQCHDTSRPGLAKATDDLLYNPHSAYHEQQACSDCHKAHEPSVNDCGQCHSDAPTPDNWAVYGK